MTLKPYSGLDEQRTNALPPVYCDEQTALLVQEKKALSSSSVTWDEKAELVGPSGLNSGVDEVPDVVETNFELHEHALEPINVKSVNQVDTLFEGENAPNLNFYCNKLSGIQSETETVFVHFNSIKSESENKFYCQMKREVELYSNAGNALINYSNNEQKSENV
ncbi:hypothetical protein Nepgr_007351 [Nepenthes gracilis]|uniref:Uncharacterized protein n=1 Tax=Nepenthes gracilis TaxID=150966 RepID=A0AAD3S7F9_NEPGR|nr:hypothetical protein Nepgr_007351 [Nepenthes gracilis]